MKTLIKMQFDPLVAKDVGVDCAIMLSNIEFWVVTNEKNNINFFEGKYWMYNSAKAFSELFNFWTEKQVRRILKTLKESGYITTGRFNKKGYDRTGWYTLLNGKLHVTKQEEPSAQMVTPIPDNKQDVINTNNIDIQPQVILTGQLPENRGKTYLLRIISVYRDLFRNEYGFNPDINIGRVSKSIKVLLQTKNELQIAALLICFFNWRGMTGNDNLARQKLLDSSHNFSWFVGSINTYESYLRNVFGLNMDDEYSVKSFVAKNMLEINK